MVRWLKVGLPLVALGLLTALFLFPRQTGFEGGLVYSTADLIALGEGMTVSNPRFSGSTEAGEPFNSHEALTPEQALEAYTLASAYASFDEERKGSVTPGKLADLVVLGEDPTTIDPEGIAEIRVLATMVGGTFVHEAAGALA